MILLLRYWKLAVVLVLVAALGVQTIRLTSVQGEVAVLEERETSAVRDQARRELHNIRAKERADENLAASRRRATTVVVRSKPLGRIASREAPAPRSGDSATECVTRGDVDVAVTNFAAQHAKGLGAVIAGVSQRFADEATSAAREFETLAAAYRACREYAREVE